MPWTALTLATGLAALGAGSAVVHLSLKYVVHRYRLTTQGHDYLERAAQKAREAAAIEREEDQKRRHARLSEIALRVKSERNT
jgi:hypothetical protein